MRLLIVLIVAYVVCSVAVESFLLGKKFVDGCNPDKCEHKGVCKLNPTNKNLSTCICPEGYHGKLCELKTGCRAKPCKKGVCSNDKVDPSKFHCKCDPGYVGEKCDTQDGCGKNPCVNGKCTLDAKLKVHCVCNAGWKGDKCSKRNCTIERFKGSHFEDKPKVWIDPVMHKKFKDLDGLAKLCGVRIAPKRSFSKQVNEKILEKNDAPFYIGRGLAFQINDKHGKLLCNEICMGKPLSTISKEAQCFLNGVDAIGFKIAAPGLIYDAALSASLTEYNKLKDQHQVGCKEEKDIA